MPDYDFVAVWVLDLPGRMYAMWAVVGTKNFCSMLGCSCLNFPLLGGSFHNPLSGRFPALGAPFIRGSVLYVHVSCDISDLRIPVALLKLEHITYILGNPD